MDEDTHFPLRDTFEWPYDLSREYAAFFGDILEFARKLVTPDPTGTRKKRVQYWTALALLRGVMSSPKAGVKMLNTRIERLAEADRDVEQATNESAENPVRDLDYGFEGDNAPTQVLELGDLSEYQRRQMNTFAERLENLGNIRQDGKLFAASVVLEEWLERGFNPGVFCRYIDTALYLGEHLGPALRQKFTDVDLQIITSEDPDDVRRQRIAGMSGNKRRVLVATDCLSEGINLQEGFDAVVHYDLSWNPTRHEQREGRVDRYGQRCREVKVVTLYGSNNAIDGIVLSVLLRKHKAIRDSLGISVPVPVNSNAVLEAILEGILLRGGDDERSADQLSFWEREVIDPQRRELFGEWERAAERERASRSLLSARLWAIATATAHALVVMGTRNPLVTTNA